MPGIAVCKTGWSQLFLTYVCHTCSFSYFFIPDLLNPLYSHHLSQHSHSESTNITLLIFGTPSVLFKCGGVSCGASGGRVDGCQVWSDIQWKGCKAEEVLEGRSARQYARWDGPSYGRIGGVSCVTRRSVRWGEGQCKEGHWVMEGI